MVPHQSGGIWDVMSRAKQMDFQQPRRRNSVKVAGYCGLLKQCRLDGEKLQ